MAYLSAALSSKKYALSNKSWSSMENEIDLPWRSFFMPPRLMIATIILKKYIPQENEMCKILSSPFPFRITLDLRIFVGELNPYQKSVFLRLRKIQNSATKHLGVDPNRNFGLQWLKNVHFWHHLVYVIKVISKNVDMHNLNNAFWLW